MAEAAHQPLAQDYECGYCLQTLVNMVDPRRLPCSHSFCLPCLQDGMRDEATECITCGQSCDEQNLEALPKATLEETATAGQEVEISEDDFTTTPCDVCEGDNFCLAICHCTECEKFLCRRHLKQHDRSMKFLKQVHTIVEMEKYVKPVKIEPEMCAKHESEKLVLACDVCHETFCLLCDTNGLCEARAGPTLYKHHVLHQVQSHHKVTGLGKLAEMLREETRKAMKSVSDKITELYELEKKSWGDLDDIEVKVGEMVREVEKITEQQIFTIKFKSKQIIADIKEYLDKSTTEVEEFTFALGQQKDKLKELWDTTSNSVLHSRDAELIKKTNEDIRSLNQAVHATVPHCLLVEKKLYSSNLRCDLPKQFLASGTEISQPRSVTKHATSVCWTKRNSLLVCGNGKITLYDQFLKEISSPYDITDSYYSAVDTPSGFIAAQSSNKKIRVDKLSKGLGFQDSLCPDINSKYYQYMTCDNKNSQIVLLDTDTKQLAFCSYNGSGYQTHPSKLESLSQPKRLHALPDGSVIISDHGNDSVHKFVIGSDSVTPVWSCDKVVKPLGITSDENGHIYVASLDGDIYELADNGVILRRLTWHIDQDMKFYDVSVSGNQIAVAGGYAGPLIFTIPEYDE